MIIEQVGGEEIGGLVRMMARQTIDRPAADLRIIIAEIPGKLFERPETLCHQGLRRSGGAMVIIADPRGSPHPLAGGRAVCARLHLINAMCREDGGEGGIRTPDTGFSQYNCLAGSPVQPLQHLSALTQVAYSK